MLPCPIVVLPVKDEFKIFQHYMYFSDRAAAGLLSDPLTALFTVALSCLFFRFRISPIIV